MDFNFNLLTGTIYAATVFSAAGFAAALLNRRAIAQKAAYMLEQAKKVEKK